MILSDTAQNLLSKRYLRRDDKGNVIETEEEMFHRVASVVAGAYFHGIEHTPLKLESLTSKFEDLMTSMKFLPNSPTLMNAGTAMKSLSACFIVDIQDNMESIFQAVKDVAIISQSGGGVGMDFSTLRPEGSIVRTSGGISSGPISFMEVFDKATDAVKQGGRRRGANMGILRIDSPDILKFITCKSKDGILKNFNISVAITNRFMEALAKDEEYELINPDTKQICGHLKASDVFNSLATHSHANGEPGVAFIDVINRFNPTPELGRIRSSNPCVVGETLIATADGRNAVSIKQLVEEGKDVPVYSYNIEKGCIDIQTARNFRKTGENMEVWKLTLDDGSHIIATPDHNFILRNGDKIKLRELKQGDSLMPFYKNERHVAKDKWTNDYYFVNMNNGNNCQEHRIIASILMNEDIENKVVHHIDGNGLNNEINNLKVMSSSEHTSFHQSGDNNVMRNKWWNNLPEDEKQEYRKNMSRSCSGQGNGMFGKKHHNRSKTMMSEKAKARITPEFRQMISERFKGNTTTKGMELVSRQEYNCCNCNKLMRLTDNEYQNKVNSNSCNSLFCSIICYNKKRHELMGTKEKVHVSLILNGLEYLKTIGEYPTCNGWDIYSKETKAPSREAVRKTFGGFTGFRQELQLCQEHNHNVMSVEHYGYEDVYNCTVDNNHNYAIISDNKYSNNGYSGIISGNCGEFYGLPWESCNLGSINISNHIVGREIDWNTLEQTVRLSVDFLDSIIDLNNFPLKKISDATLKTRKIGLGVMGWADTLCKMKIPYDSDDALNLAEQVMGFISKKAKEESLILDSLNKSGRNPNKQLTIIAPTGSISMIANCSPGIEPLFSVVYKKNVLEGYLMVNPIFEKELKDRGLWSEELLDDISSSMSIQNCKYLPRDIKEIYKTAHDISPEWHIKMQAAFQKHVDSGISKTINLPSYATVEDVKKAYLLAYKLGCKGVTVYRDGSRLGQPVTQAKQKSIEPSEVPDTITGTTTKINTGCGVMRVTVNCDKNGPVEMFANIGKAGGCMAANAEAQARLVSLGLRTGIPIKTIIRQLEGIMCPCPQIGVSSCPDAIAKVLKKYDNFGGCARAEEACASSTHNPGLANIGYNIECPECGNKLIFREGCMSCTCGYSKCG